MPKRGFTIIELLIVISIIAILSVIGLVMYTTFLKNAKDAKRQSDLRTIQSSLEQYYADQNFYPSTMPSAGSPLTSSTGNSSSPLPSPVKTYLNSVPVDPITGTATPYAYQAISSSSYCIYAKMDNPTNALITPPTPCSYAAPYDNYNFAVTLP